VGDFKAKVFLVGLANNYKGLKLLDQYEGKPFKFNIDNENDKYKHKNNPFIE